MEGFYLCIQILFANSPPFSLSVCYCFSLSENFLWEVVWLKTHKSSCWRSKTSFQPKTFLLCLNSKLERTYLLSLWPGSRRRTGANLARTMMRIRWVTKSFYNRETNSAAFCVIQQISFNFPFPSMQFKLLNLFLIQWVQPIMKRGRNFDPLWNLYFYDFIL